MGTSSFSQLLYLQFIADKYRQWWWHRAILHFSDSIIHE